MRQLVTKHRYAGVKQAFGFLDFDRKLLFDLRNPIVTLADKLDGVNGPLFYPEAKVMGNRREVH